MYLFSNKDEDAMLYETKAGPVYASPYFRVSNLIKKIPTNCEPEEVEIFVREKGQEEFTFRIPKNEVHDAKLFHKYCTEHDFFITPDFLPLVHHDVILGMASAKRKKLFQYENKSVGWCVFDGQPIFLMDSRQLPNGAMCHCIRDMGRWQDGKIETYDQMLETYVYPNHRLSLAYILGFSGVLVARISKKRDLGVLLAGLSGQSTTGKTTAIKLIASIWADPDDVEGRVIMRSDASNIGFNAQFAGFNGISIIFDDVDQNTALDLPNQLNRLSRGAQRVVANTKGEATYNRMGFGGVCIFASECPLLEKTRKESGLYPRFLDLQDITWTNDSKSAEDIKEVCSDNFGFKGKEFASFIEKKRDEELCQYFDDAYKFIDSQITQRDRFTPRSIKKYASILTTSILLTECFGVQFNTQEIIKLLLNSEKTNKEDRDKPQMAYDYIKQFFIENCSNFNVLSKDKANAIKPFSKAGHGVAAYRDKILHLYMKTSTVEDILAKAGFPQLSNYKKVWKEKGWIRCETDRYDSSKTTLMPARHFHFIYREDNDVLEQYIFTFRDQPKHFLGYAPTDPLNTTLEALTPETESDEVKVLQENKDQNNDQNNSVNRRLTMDDIPEEYDDSAVIAEIFKD